MKVGLRKLDDEIGIIKEDTTSSVNLYNELGTNSFKLTEAEIKRLQDEHEEDKEEEKNPFDDDIEDEDDEDDPESKKELDMQIMNKVDDLVKQTDKITKEHKARDEKLLKKFEQGKLKICIPATTVCFKNFSKMLIKIAEALDQAVETSKSEYLREFVSYVSKMPIVGDILYGALKDNPDCIYYKPLAHSDWDLLFSCYDYEQPKSLKTFMSQYQRICEFMAYLSAVLGRESYEDGNMVFSLMKSAKWAVYYALFKKRRNEQFNLFMSNPDVDVALKVYNLQDTMFLQDSLKYIYPTVKLHKVIYVPMITDELTIGGLNTVLKNYQKGGRTKEKNFPKQLMGIDPNFEIFKGSKYDASKYVKVRIISNVKFPMNWEDKYVLAEGETRKPKEGENQSSLFNHLIKDTTKKVETVSTGCCGLFGKKQKRFDNLNMKNITKELVSTTFQ